MLNDLCPLKTIRFLHSLWYTNLPYMRSVQACLLKISCSQGRHHIHKYIHTHRRVITKVTTSLKSKSSNDEKPQISLQQTGSIVISYIIYQTMQYKLYWENKFSLWVDSYHFVLLASLILNEPTMVLDQGISQTWQTEWRHRINLQ